MLACPMTQEEGAVGAVILCSASRDAFCQADRDLLMVLSCQLASHFWCCELKRQLERAPEEG